MISEALVLLGLTGLVVLCVYFARDGKGNIFPFWDWPSSLYHCPECANGFHTALYRRYRPGDGTAYFLKCEKHGFQWYLPAGAPSFEWDVIRKGSKRAAKYGMYTPSPANMATARKVGRREYVLQPEGCYQYRGLPVLISCE